MHLTPSIRALQRTHAPPNAVPANHEALVPLEQRDHFFTAIDAAVDEIRFGMQCAAAQHAHSAGETAVETALQTHYTAIAQDRKPSLLNLANTPLRDALQTNGFHAGENAVTRFASQIEHLQTTSAAHPLYGPPTVFRAAHAVFSPGSALVAKADSVWKRPAPFTMYQPPVELQTHVVNDTASALGLCARAAVAKGTGTTHTFIDLLRDLTRNAVHEHVAGLARRIAAAPEDELGGPQRQAFLQSCSELKARARDHGARVADQALQLVIDHAKLDRALRNPEWFPAFQILDILSPFCENGNAAEYLHARLPVLNNFLGGPVRVAMRVEPTELESVPYRRELVSRMRDTDKISGMVLDCARNAVDSTLKASPVVSQSAQLLNQLEISLSYFDMARLNEQRLVHLMVETEPAPRTSRIS